MFNKKTFSKLMVAMAAVLSISVSTAYAQQDYSRSYQFGGVLRAPNAGNSGGGATQRPILEVGSSFDAGGILGCSGLDISGMLENTFNVGNLGDEFKNYLQNTIATEALSLLYSQPGVSQVLDGMKAIGHARVSIQQEQCNANEIFADVTNRRMRDEAHAECLRENRVQTACEGSALEPYVEAIAQSRRWSGTLHDHVCEEGSRLCDFLPNFAYDVGTGEGQSSTASVPPGVVSDTAEYAANACLEARGAQARALIDEVGYSEALRLTATGERVISCDPEVLAGGGNGGGGDGDGDGGNGGNGGNVDASPLAAFSSVNECVVEAGGEQIDVSDLTQALRTGTGQEGIDRVAALNPMALVQEHANCIVSREIHPHVDINTAMLPDAEREGARRAISQTVRTKAAVNLYNALITALSEALINSGSTESSDPETSINPQTREFIIAQLEAFKAARDSILMDTKLSKEVANTVSGMNERLDSLQGSAMRNASGAFSQGGANAGINSRGYSGAFNR